MPPFTLDKKVVRWRRVTGMAIWAQTSFSSAFKQWNEDRHHNCMNRADERWTTQTIFKNSTIFVAAKEPVLSASWDFYECCDNSKAKCAGLVGNWNNWKITLFIGFVILSVIVVFFVVISRRYDFRSAAHILISIQKNKIYYFLRYIVYEFTAVRIYKKLEAVFLDERWTSGENYKTSKSHKKFVFFFFFFLLFYR